MPNSSYQNKYRLLLAYDGTKFSGWQIQPNSLTIQEILRDTLSLLLKEPVYPVGSGRTDAGVHAKGQVAHFLTSKTPDLKKLFRSLNGVLPPEIRVLSIEKAEDTFHSRYSARGKEYHYHLHLDPAHDPFTHLYRWKVPYKLDLDLLKQAASLFVGEHDFASFANEATKGAAGKNSVRTLYRLDIVPEEGGIRLEFEGNGFLYKMVRNIVGMLVEVASGKREIEEITTLFELKDRTQAARAAPAKGLFLVRVNYPQDTPL